MYERDHTYTYTQKLTRMLHSKDTGLHSVTHSTLTKYVQEMEIYNYTRSCARPGSASNTCMLKYVLYTSTLRTETKNKKPTWRGCFVGSQGKGPVPKHLQRWHLPRQPNLRVKQGGCPKPEEDVRSSIQLTQNKSYISRTSSGVDFVVSCRGSQRRGCYLETEGSQTCSWVLPKVSKVDPKSQNLKHYSTTDL